MPKFAVYGVGALVALVLLFLFSPVFVVSPGERAVVTSLGSVEGTYGNGPHLKLPFFQSAHYISVQPQTKTYEKLSTYSKDQQTADLKLSITYHVTDATSVYVNFTDQDTLVTRIVDPRIAQALKQVFGKFSAADSIQNRSVLEGQVTMAVETILAGQPVHVDSVQIENIDFDDAYEHAIQEQMKKVVALRAAESTAAQVKLTADADAYKVTKEGEAQASAIRARGDALKENPGIPALVAAERWDGHLPTTMPPNGAVPFLNLAH